LSTHIFSLIQKSTREKMSLSLFNAVPDIETLFIDSQPWFKQGDVGEFIGFGNMRQVTSKLSPEDKKKRSEITVHLMDGSYNPPKHAKPHDAFLSVNAVATIVMHSRKPNARRVATWLIKEIIPRGFNAKIKEIREEQYAAYALLNDDLTESQHQVIVLQDRVIELQEQIVPHLEDRTKNNGMVIIQENNDDEYPYVAICGQQGYVAQKIRNKMVDYPNAQIVVLAETPNAIIHYNWLRERECIVANPNRVRHFRLGDHYTHQRRMELEEA
jgi:prophage antirepressor-like protein